MSPLRILHTADVHYGVENYGRIDGETGLHTRLLDFDRAFGACVDAALAHDVDCFIFAGDAYKTAHPTPTHQRMLLNQLMRVTRAGIPVVMVVGNHDHPVSFGKAHALDVFDQLRDEGFHVFSKPRTCTIQTKQGPLQIAGLPWPTRGTLSLFQRSLNTTASSISDSVSTALHAIVDHLAGQLDPLIPAVLVGHITVSTGVFSGSERQGMHGRDPIVHPSTLARAPFDYIALGHLHRYQNLNTNGHPAIVYSGSPERIDFGERSDNKSCCLVTIYDKQTTTHTCIPTPTRPFIQIDVILHPGRPHTEQVLEALAQHDITDAVVKIVYHVPEHERDTVDRLALHKALRTAHVCAGIIPILKPRARRTRSREVSHVRDVQTLIRQYCTLNSDFQEKAEQLIARLAELEQQSSETAPSTHEKSAFSNGKSAQV